MSNEATYTVLREADGHAFPSSKDCPDVKHDRKVLGSNTFNVGRRNLENAAATEETSWSFAKKCCSRGVVAPDDGGHLANLLEVWDAWIGLLLLFTAFDTPLQACLHVDRPPFWLSCGNLLVDLCFALDLFLQFNVAIPVPQETLTYQAHQSDYNRCNIARNYITSGWFFVDALSCAPLWRKLITALLKVKLSGKVEYLKIIRLLRLLRTFKLGRLIRRWQAHFGVSYRTVDLVKFLFITSLTCHWFACSWVMAGGESMKGTSWLSALIDAKGWDDAKVDRSSTYILALYWATMTITTVGYGDVVPQNMFEYGLCTVFMICAGFVWAFLVGSVCGLITQQDSMSQFKSDMEDLNDLMEEQDLPQTLRIRMRIFMEKSKSMFARSGHRALCEKTMSEGLQREIARVTAKADIFASVYWVQGIDEDALLACVRALGHSFWGPREAVTIRDMLIIIRCGFMAARGVILRCGDSWNSHNILLDSQHLMETSHPVTLTYVSALHLTKQDLHDIARTFPEVNRRLRHAQIRAASFRAFCLVALEQKAASVFQHKKKMKGNGPGFARATPSHHGVLMEVSRLGDKIDYIRATQDRLALQMEDMACQVARISSEGKRKDDLLYAVSNQQDKIQNMLEKIMEVQSHKPSLFPHIQK